MLSKVEEPDIEYGKKPSLLKGSSVFIFPLEDRIETGMPVFQEFIRIAFEKANVFISYDSKEKKNAFNLSWEGSLKELSSKFDSVSLQKHINTLRK